MKYLIFIVLFGLNGVQAAELPTYRIQSVYNDNSLTNPSDVWRHYQFYVEKLDQTSLRKIANLNCVSGFKNQGYNLKLQIEKNKILHDKFLTSLNEEINDPGFSFQYSYKSYDFHSHCLYDLAILYRKLLRKSATLSFYDDIVKGFYISDEVHDISKEDKEFVEKMKQSVKTSIGEVGNIAFYHGRRTEYVFIFLHGFNMSANYFWHQAREVFSLGNNSVSYTFPCQRVTSNKCQMEPRMWKEDLKKLVRDHWSDLGKKVILVGHSFGAHIAIQLAQEKLADGLILLEPAIRLTSYSENALALGDKLDNSLNNDLAFLKEIGKSVKNHVNIENDISDTRISIPTLIYAQAFDPVVSYSAINRFAKNNKEFVTVIKKTHLNVLINHMYNPFHEDNEFSRIYYFIIENIK